MQSPDQLWANQTDVRTSGGRLFAAMIREGVVTILLVLRRIVEGLQQLTELPLSILFGSAGTGSGSGDNRAVQLLQALDRDLDMSFFMFPQRVEHRVPRDLKIRIIWHVQPLREAHRQGVRRRDRPRETPDAVGRRGTPFETGVDVLIGVSGVRIAVEFRNGRCATRPALWYWFHLVRQCLHC